MRVQLRLVVLMALLVSAWPAFAQVRVSITVAPPPLPVYSQPPCPGPGYIWTPGYWDWDDVSSGYYWVPGTWVLPPTVGLLWTPGYWTWQGAGFAFIHGYWGPTVGFYGDIDYGFGYPGRGFFGGRWRSGRFFYNRSVTNVNVTVVHNTYIRKVEAAGPRHRESYDGGRGGIRARPTARELSAARQRHLAATAAQRQHVRLARSMPRLHASENNGKPPVLATDRPGALRSRASAAARRESARGRTLKGRSSEQRAHSRPLPHKHTLRETSSASARRQTPHPSPRATPRSRSSFRTDHGERSVANDRSHGSRRPERRSGRAQPPRAASHARLGNDRSREEHRGKTDRRRKKKRGNENGRR